LIVKKLLTDKKELHGGVENLGNTTVGVADKRELDMSLHVKVLRGDDFLAY